MRLLDNDKISKICAFLSIGIFINVKNTWDRAPVSILNRHPLLTVILGIIWCITAIQKSTTAKIINLISSITIFGMLLYRLLFEMKIYFPLTANDFSIGSHVLIIISFILFMFSIYFGVKNIHEQSSDIH